MADIIFPGNEPIDNLGASRLPGNMDLSMWQGDVQDYVIKLTNSDGTAIPLTGKTAQAVITSTPGGTTTYDFTCTIQNGNEVRMYMSSAITKTIAAGSYVWNFQITETATQDVRTYLAGDVTVHAEVS